MKKNFLSIIIFHLSGLACSQTPVVLRTDMTISQVVQVAAGANRICYSNLDSSLYYGTLSGEIYKVTIPASGPAADTLLYTTADHGIPFMQGMEMRDSVLYVSGNLNKDSALTTGVIMKGVLQTGFQRVWSAVAQTVPYETAGDFDHLFSGMTLNLGGDTLLVCSGSRGDHGEVNTRNGLFPLLRNLPLTSVILRIPANATNLLIPKDSASLDSLDLVFARGIRNTYDFAYDASGELFGCENSGDRDVEDELNWLREGHHYGFPWIMGGTENPQQYQGYDPATDLLINHSCLAWNNGLFTNDSLFPPVPPGLVMQPPCENLGPDAGFMRDSITGLTYNASGAGQTIRSFTPHRSPLGITFDHDSILGNDLRGCAFVLSYTRGDSAAGNPSPLLAPFHDSGEDLLMLQMEKDTNTDNYRFHCWKIAEKFRYPLDAVLTDTLMYVIEFGYSGNKSIWQLGFPRHQPVAAALPENLKESSIQVFPNPAGEMIRFEISNANPYTMYEMEVRDISGRTVFHNSRLNFKTGFELHTGQLETGSYTWRLTGNSGKQFSGRITVMH